MLGDADAPMDVDSRFGQNQQVQQVLKTTTTPSATWR